MNQHSVIWIFLVTAILSLMFNYNSYSKKEYELAASSLTNDTVKSSLGQSKDLEVENSINKGESEVMLSQSLRAVNTLSKRDKEKYFVLSKEMVLVFFIDAILLLICIIMLLMISIYKRKRTETLLRESRQHYKELLMSMPNSVILLENKEVKFINQFGKVFLGVDKDKKPSYADLQYMLGESIDFEDISLFPMQIKTQIKTLYNEVKDVELTAVISDKLKHSKSIILLIQDVSDKRLLYESIERDKIRNEFFANLSHEFKTPINLILTSSQLLDKVQDKGEDLKKILPKSTKILKQNAYRLIRLVNNVIDSTRIDGDDVKLELHNCNIIELTEDITLSTVSYAKANGINVLFDTELEELEMAVDRDKYERIILNLLSNAIKYNKPNGEIYVNMSLKENTIVISIKDTGIGISENMLPYIFEKFMQVNKSLIRNVEGSGVGLSIVKSFVKLHNGKIEVNSCEGEGTAFILCFPIYKIEEKTANKGEKVLTKYNDTHTQIELSDIWGGQ